MILKVALPELRNVDARLPGFKSWFCLTKSCLSQLASLCFTFPINSMWLIMYLPHGVIVPTKYGTVLKVLKIMLVLKKLLKDKA